MKKENESYQFLVDGNYSFVTGSLKSILSEMEIGVEAIDLSTVKVDQMESLTPLVLAESEVLLTYPKQREIFYDWCIRQGIHLILIGEQKNLDELMRVTTKGLVVELIKRPFNAKTVVERLDELMEIVRKDGFRKKILVVDDSPTFLRTVSEWLEEEYVVSICPSAAAAFQIMEQYKPDLILLDYEMPVCSGAQFLEMLHSEKATASIPVIFLTSKSDSETVSKVLSLGPQGYILKTQTKIQILSYIKAFFEGK